MGIGKANLLMNKKGRFVQFNTLIENCEFSLGEKETTCMDLQGFWEMIYFQVEDIQQLFSDLEKLEQNNWIQEKINPIKNPPKKKLNIVKPAKPKAAASSNLKQMLMAKRKAMKEKIDTQNDVQIVVEKPEETVQFDAGFFKVESPIKLSPSPKKAISSIQSAKSSENSLRRSLLAKRASMSAGINPSTPFCVMSATKSIKRSLSRENSPVVMKMEFDADEDQESKENVDDNKPKFNEKFVKSNFHETIIERRSQRLSVTPRKNYKE